MNYAYRVLSEIFLILFFIIPIPILYYFGGPALKAVCYLLLFIFYTIMYILSFLIYGPKEPFLWREFIDDYIISSLWGDTVYAAQKIWELITSNYSLLLGLMIAAYLVRSALLKIYAMKASQTPVKPILRTYFDAAQLKHDREGNLYVAVGILADAINEHAYYIAFYHRDQRIHFVSIWDERPYNLSLENQYIKQIEKEIVPFRNKYIEQMEKTLNNGQAGKKGRTEEILAELDSLIGLEAVKREVRRILALAEAQAVRRRMGMPPLEQSWHMAFVGNPGTGKTTVARLIGELFGAVGLLPSGHLVTVGKADLVERYIGHTAHRTREVVQKSLGGILFVDEAYELADPGLRGEGFGGEALTEILVAMENYRDRLVVIVAGYSDVVEKLSKVNEGFRSRIGQVIEFPDYSAPELLEIAILAAKKQGFDLIPEAQEALLAHFRQIESQAGKLGNGRYARNVIERCISAAVTKDPAAVTITADDVEHRE